ncbi:unnamed protein product [Echinostoma caproni]|uniref:Retrotransposon protein n=1 Tax=Echinostoma caproni TaxID=27848 RepID=A0A183B3A2_9TREM|nr:unnamed protein product [Echinostoma caproni]
MRALEGKVVSKLVFDARSMAEAIAIRLNNLVRSEMCSEVAVDNLSVPSNCATESTGSLVFDVIRDRQQFAAMVCPQSDSDQDSIYGSRYTLTPGVPAMSNVVQSYIAALELAELESRLIDLASTSIEEWYSVDRQFFFHSIVIVNSTNEFQLDEVERSPISCVSLARFWKPKNYCRVGADMFYMPYSGEIMKHS